MNKIAFITMDMESFFDSGCMKRNNISPDEEFDCAQEVERFIDYLDSINIKATLFVRLCTFVHILAGCCKFHLFVAP